MFSLSMRHRISLTFGFIMVFAISMLTTITWTIQKQQATAAVQGRLLESTIGIIDKMSVMRAILDTRRYENKLNYYLSDQRAAYREVNCDLTQFLLDKNGRIQKAIGTRKHINFDQNELKLMFEQKQGILHIERNNERLIGAYGVSTETGQLLILLVSEQDYLKPIKDLRNLFLGLGLIAFFMAYGLIYYNIHLITKPIESVTARLKEAQSGKLESKLSVKSTFPEFVLLVDAFNQMVEFLSFWISRVKVIADKLNVYSLALAEQAHRVREDSSNIIAHIHGIADDVARQVVSLEKTNSATEHLLESSSNIVVLNRKAVETNDQIIDLVKNGENAVCQADAMMSLINSAFINTLWAFTDLQEKLVAVLSVNSEIKSIASQTKLLSLNAALEGARAGTAGQGFMVVANAISSLSDETHALQETTAALIREITAQVQRLSDALAAASQNVRDGTTSISKVRDVFSNIQESVILNHSAVEEVFTNASLILTLVETVAGNVNNVFHEASQIDSLVPEIRELACDQTKNTDTLLELSQELEAWAARLGEEIATITTAQENSEVCA